jgi:hypothetical protein
MRGGGEVMRAMRRILYLLTFLLVGALMPFGIVVAGARAFKERGRYLTLIVDRAMRCRIDTQCPPGFICHNGRCVLAD